MNVIVAGYLLLVPLIILASWGHWLLLGTLLHVALFLVVYPAVRTNCQWFGPVIQRFDTEQREVWLTIDDGPHPEDTPDLLELLKRFDARATFFVVGRLARKHPELIAAAAKSGHTIGNHSNTHPSALFWCLPTVCIQRQMDECTKILAPLVNSPCRLFRAPVGMANWSVHIAARKRGLRLVGWSSRGLDGISRDPAAIAARILRTVQPGGIILLHEGRRDKQHRRVNLIAIETLLSRLRADGYSFIIPAEERCWPR